MARGYALLSAYAAADGHPGRARRRAARRLGRGPARRPPRPGRQGRAQRLHRDPGGLGRGALRPRAAPRPWCAGRPRGARRVDHLPVDDDARLRDRGAGARRRAAARAPGSRRQPAAGGRARADDERRRDRARRTSSTRPGCAATRWTGCSATTGSRSPRGAASSSSSTSSRGRWCPTSCCRCPTSRGKGVLVAPTVYGNVLLGPTADDLDDKTATGTTEAGLEALRRQGSRILPALLDEEVTTTYAGLRAATEHGDYQVELHPEQGYVCVGGIRSTGLTASLALAEHVAELMAEAGWTTGAGARVDAADHAEHRRGVPAALRATGPGGDRPRVRPDRVPLRAGDLGRDPRRPRRARSRRSRPRACGAGPGRGWAAARASSAAQRCEARLQGARRTSRCRRDPDRAVGRRPRRRRRPGRARAAAALAAAGAGSVEVLDREPEAGGIPRHSHHTGYGLRDLHRVMTGPAYARRRVELAEAAGAHGPARGERHRAGPDR